MKITRTAAAFAIAIGVFLVNVQCRAAVPSSLANAKYKVYSADISGDGCPDYLVKAADVIIILPLDDDLIIPIPVPSQSKPVLLLSNGTCQSFTSQQATPAQLADARWQPAAYSALVGDVLGDGTGSLLLAPTSDSSSTAFNLTRGASDGAFSLLQAISVQSFGLGSGAVISLEYANADSRSDIVVRNGLQVIAAFTAGMDGMFTSGTSDLVATSKLVWKSFTDALKGASPTDSLQLVSSQTRSIFSDALSSAGANPSGFSESISTFFIISTSDTYVKAAFIANRGGQPMLYYVIFGKDVDGVWKIYSI